MSFSKQVWDQLKSKTADDFIAALNKDDWEQDTKVGASFAFKKKNSSARVTIHYHPKKTYGAKLLNALLSDIGWTEDDMKRLKLVK